MTTPAIKLVHVVAFDHHRCIGGNNTLLWHIPADLQHFKALTTGSHIIMGRKTFLSLGRPLPNRTHYVVSRDKDWQVDGVYHFDDIDTAIDTAKINAQRDNHDKVFIIGGGQIYEQTINMADILEITHVQTQAQGDTFYPKIPPTFIPIWQSDIQTDPKSGIEFYFARYEKQTQLIG